MEFNAFKDHVNTETEGLPKVFVRKDPCWHIEVYRRHDGGAKIVRYRGIGCERYVWDAVGLTPEQWVNAQNDPTDYKSV